jgi:hypothetical protein
MSIIYTSLFSPGTSGPDGKQPGLNVHHHCRLSPLNPILNSVFVAVQYSRAYYRATYIATSFDAGFATAMPIRPKWLRDICSVLFAGYYMVWAREADEKVSLGLFACRQGRHLDWKRKLTVWLTVEEV